MAVDAALLRVFGGLCQAMAIMPFPFHVYFHESPVRERLGSSEGGVVCWHEGMPPEQIVTPALQTPGSPVVQALVPAAQMPRSPLELLHRVQRIESGAHWGVGHTGGLDQNSA